MDMHIHNFTKNGQNIPIISERKQRLMDEQTRKLLEECTIGCQMASDSLRQIREYIKDSGLAELVDSYTDRHEKMRQEADVFEKPLLDVKGVNFFKSTSSEKTTKFIYDDVLMEQLLQPKDGKIRLDRVISTIYAYQQKMEKEIASGDMGYLKRSIKVKSPDGYSKPMSIGQYKAVWVWNKICEQKDLIELPATVTLVKVKASKPADIACLAAEYPDIYEKLMYLFENEVYVGGGKIIEKKDGVEVEKKIAMPGIKAIALPVDYDEVPEWMLKIIDVETLVNDNLRLFSQLFRPLGLVPSNASHNGSSLTYYSNIVRI